MFSVLLGSKELRVLESVCVSWQWILPRVKKGSMNTFEKDFTKALETCVVKGSAEIPVLSSWSPGRNAPLEVHVRHGLASQVPIESIHYQLRRNATFQQITNWLRIQFSESVLQQVSRMAVDDEKVQVWYFGRWWLNSYVEYLLDPLTQRSTFYKERHEEFLGLLRHMLEIQVSRRIPFRAALSAWHPDSDLLKTVSQTEDDADASDAESPPAPSVVPSLPQSVPPPAVSAVSASPSLPAVPITSPHRLVLKGFGGRGVRSRTRRNLCSSDLTPATGNHD